eukprot:gnl/MRDRNA2_/MRDRNA2_95410_c0_seq1.p1 gnl/MRDRNA2_/MRDRNA2_95410_c0~~gnl/MRDRNA2_/MRDRNA2_95410_c0_seq1.p1  ORF type:complete len:324 (-),score=67.52 gnl/MRDRNA2_/MRDRNA2_95410_c0_seq1:91-1062(-)
MQNPSDYASICPGMHALSLADLQREAAWFEVLDGHEDSAKLLAAQGLDPKDPHTLAEMNEDLLDTLGITDRSARAMILALSQKVGGDVSSGQSKPRISSKSADLSNSNLREEEDEAPTFGRFRRRCFAKKNGRILAQEVVPGIFLGGAAAAESREEQHSLGITHVLNATGHQPKAPLDGIKMLMLHLRDGDGEQDLTQHFPKCIDFIDEARREGGAVLVHCVRGVSRSSALVISYLIAHAGISFEDALALTKRARPIAKPRSGFCKQLRAFSSKIQGVSLEEPATSQTGLRNLKENAARVIQSRLLQRRSLQSGRTIKKMVEP